MATKDWKAIPDDPISSGDQQNKDEPRARDAEKWLMPSSDDLKQHPRVAGSPEDLNIKPGDLKLLPSEVGSDLDSWSDDPIESSEGFDAFYWDTNALRTEVLDP